LITITLFCAPGGTEIGCRLVNDDTGAVFDAAYSTDIPAATTLLATHMYLNNGGAAAAVAYDTLRVWFGSDN
jgi:hypothetical protein